MVLLGNNKYACETCIKGHRSSTCRHTDRPLFEIKKKGRPVTQCDHCRELRKTKQVHVKCICEGKEDNTVAVFPPAIKKGHTKIPGSATFPDGLPAALGTSVALLASSEAVSSDSDSGGCMCKVGGACRCCTPRKSISRGRKRSNSSGNRSIPSSPAATHSSRTPLHILARLAELRPVLPRPTRPSNDPPMRLTHGSHGRHLSHENLLFSPYGRAYDLTHHEQEYDQFRNRSVPNIVMSNAPMTPPLPAEEQRFREQLRALEAAAASPVLMHTSSRAMATAQSFPSVCGCGDNCTCPGCRQHNDADANAPSSSAFSSCTKPGVCNSCLDCTILSLPASLPPDSSLSIFDAYQADSIDEWIRQVSSLPRDPPGASQQDAWDNYLSPITEPPSNTDESYRVQQCCGVLCKCSPEMCRCELDRPDGYDCRRESMTPDSIAMFASSDNRSVATSSFDNMRTSMPGNGVGVVGIYGTGLARSQSAGSLDPSSGSWGIRAYPDPLELFAQTTRSRSSSSSSSNQFDFPSDSNNIHATSASFSLPDLGDRLQLEYQSDTLRSIVNASPPLSLYGRNGTGKYSVSNPDSDGYSAEGEADELVWKHPMPAQSQHHWPRTN